MLIPILIAVGVVVAIGVVVGILLGVLAEKFKVKTDERGPLVRECLAGANCGACGFAGCDAYAAAIVAGTAKPSLCPAADNKRIGEIMGVDAKAAPKNVAFVRCSGTCRKTNANYNYLDVHDCRIAYLAPGHGSKKCAFGCCGFGSCAKVCPFDAIRIVDDLAVVDETKCTACGTCITACPNHLIEIIPADAKYVVRCSSRSRGKDVRDACADGCIGCGMCMRICEHGAITVTGNLARIDQEKCVGCGKCAEKCPSKIIIKRK
ncbi:MAG: RnfABCDGE type electron transport complex subunit B [Clostridia bacterium]|nr:RnfABCDGE type electron transport complex subunit B [Clostridia bacterium]